MTADEPEGRLLEQAADRCRRLLDDLRRDAAALARPSTAVAPDALAEGRAAYDRASAAAAALLRHLDESTDDPTDRPQ